MERRVWHGDALTLQETLDLAEEDALGEVTLLLNVLAAVTRGRPLPVGRDSPLNGSPVLYLTAEDSLSKTVVKRLRAAGADMGRVWLQKVGAGELVFPGGIGALDGIIRARKCRVVALDPFNAYLDASEINVNREQDVRRALRPLRELAEVNDVAVIGLRHLNKASDKPSLYRGGGSIGLAAVARSVVLVAKHPDDRDLRVVLSQKCNLIEEAKKKPQGFRIGQDREGRACVEWLN